MSDNAGACIYHWTRLHTFHLVFSTYSYIVIKSKVLQTSLGILLSGKQIHYPYAHSKKLFCQMVFLEMDLLSYNKVSFLETN